LLCFPVCYNKPTCFQVPYTSVPLKLAVPHIRTVASGLRHSAIITRDGKVLVCGNGKNGQLGLTDSSGLPIVEVDHPQEGTPEKVGVCQKSAVLNVKAVSMTITGFLI
jgi:alpha-tubulin suppressor-like RCC1 family protein